MTTAPPIDQLSATFSALSDPTRRAILSRLADGEASVQELSRPFDMTLPAVSKHLKVLQRAGLVEQGRRAQWRPCRIKAEPLKVAADWVEQYRALWEERFDRLDGYLQELKQRAGSEAQEPPRLESPGYVAKETEEENNE